MILGVLSFAFFLAGIGNPKTMVFDEKLYVDGGNAILRATRDPSPYGPPLGKLIIAGSIARAGDNPFAWRLPSALLGSLAVPAVFLILIFLLNDYTLALAGTALALLNNFLYVFSRTAMMDVFLVTFALWGVVAFVAALKLEGIGRRARRASLAFGGVMLGAATSCKWNGVDELAVIVVLGGFLLLWSKKTKNQEFVKCGANLREAGIGWFALSFVVLPVFVYLASFWPLFRSQGIPFSPGELVSANLFIWRFHRQVIGNIGLIVPVYRWPLMIEPTRGLSYLVGNWYVMWAGLIALLFCVRRFGRCLPETLIISLYAVNMLQWIVTPQHCVFYYYYFPAAMFLGMAIPVALLRLPTRCFGLRLSVLSVIPAFCVFVYCFAHMAHLGAPFDTMLGYWV